VEKRPLNACSSSYCDTFAMQINTALLVLKSLPLPVFVMTVATVFTSATFGGNTVELSSVCLSFCLFFTG